VSREGPRDRLLLLGASVRALAASVLRSRRARDRHPGDLLLLDFFADDDLARRPRVRFPGPGGLARPRSTAALGRAALALAAGGEAWGGLLFTGGLENHPGLLRLLARHAPILGNDPRAVARVRDPAQLAGVLEREGLLHAGVSALETAPADGRWLLKRRRGAGGSGVREAPPGERRRPGEFLQARLDGAAGSIAFVAGGGEARLLGATTLLDATGSDAAIAALAAPPFRYAGNIAGPMDAMLPPEALRLLARAASRITARFELCGLNGIDYVLTDRGPVVLEVNPRFTASMEILEECRGESFIDRHLEALDGALSSAAPPASAYAAPGSPEPEAAATDWRAKGILYADRPLVAPDPDLLVPLGARDRPRRGETFEPGRPLCTLVVTGTGASDCRRRLAERALEARGLFLSDAGPQHRP